MEEAMAATKALRSDPVMAKILDKPRVQAAIKEVQQDQRAMARYINDPEVMQVLTRLLEAGVSPEEARAFAEFGTTPVQVATTVYANPELADLMLKPIVQQALAAGARGDIATFEALAEQHSDVMRALDIMDSSLRG